MSNEKDTIYRQDAIDAAKCIVEHHAITPYKTMATAMDHLKRILDGMPSAQPDPQWILCSERLPKESGTYIVTAYDGVSRRVTFVKYQKRLNRWDLSGARAYWHIHAWLPLPEPYKSEDEA